MANILELVIQYIIVFITGLTIGSFINCLVWRQNNNMRVAVGRSQCPHCCRKLSWWENIPLFSYFFLGKRCRTCKKRIPAYYPLVEFFTGILFIHAYGTIIRHFSSDWIYLARELTMLSVLTIIFVSDVLYRLIWPSVVWFGLIAIFLFNLFLGKDVLSMAIGLLAGCGFFLFQYLISKGRWIGGGDVRMGAMMGVWLGWPSIIVALMIAYFFGAIIGVILILSGRKQWASAIAFGPYLVIATFLAHYFSEAVIQYFHYLI